MRVITKNTANKRPPARTFFCFTYILIPLVKYQHMEFVEEESINDSEQNFFFKVSTSIIKFALKIDYFGIEMLFGMEAVL